MTRPVTIYGAGVWGTALAIAVARSGHRVTLSGRDAASMEVIAANRCNKNCLPGIDLPESIVVCTDSKGIDPEETDIIFAVPMQSLRIAVQQLTRDATGLLRIAWACKGLEYETNLLPHQVVRDVLHCSAPLAALSGPNFATEIAAGLPAAIVVAADDPEFCDDLVGVLHSGNLRAYATDDLTGVEVGGALKNVIAIAAGINDGLGLGANARAALITRGLAEITRLGVAMGGRRETFMGLSGVGDLVLTAGDDQSRNRRLGLALARGDSMDAALRKIGGVIEGMHTARIAAEKAASLGLELPICQQVADVIEGRRSPADAVAGLLARGKPDSE